MHIAGAARTWRPIDAGDTKAAGGHQTENQTKTQKVSFLLEPCHAAHILIGREAGDGIGVTT